MMRILMLIALAFTIAGCGHKGLTSIDGGESKVFEAPPYAVRGKTGYDQNWIDSQIEGGVAAFGWPRPKPRPPELDRPRAPKVIIAPTKKRKLIGRIKERVWPVAAPPVVATPAPTVVGGAAPDPPPTPPSPPRAAVDELLDYAPTIRRVH